MRRLYHLVEMFKRPKAAGILSQFTHLGVVSPNKTRWGSVLAAMNRIRLIARPIRQALAAYDAKVQLREVDIKIFEHQ